MTGGVVAEADQRDAQFCLVGRILRHAPLRVRVDLSRLVAVALQEEAGLDAHLGVGPMLAEIPNDGRHHVPLVLQVRREVRAPPVLLCSDR